MISRKELIAILLLVTALICILNASLFGKIMPTGSSYVQLTQQSVSTGTAYICILYALSTWLYHSNYSEPRQHMRYVLLTMLIILILANLTALAMIIKMQFFSPVNDSIRSDDLFSTFGLVCNKTTIVLLILVILLLIIVFVIVCMNAINKNKLRHIKFDFSVSPVSPSRQ